ncbi:MAG: DUF6603 domain-containing protein [Paracoccaceae bacterium]
MLGGVEVEAQGGFAAHWSSREGWRFAGGLELEIEVPIDRSVGPFFIDSITFMGGASTEGLSTGVAVTGSFTLGPVWLFFDKMGVTADIEPMDEGQSGNLGAVDVTPRFKPPEGYGAKLDFGPITGGGIILKEGDEYRGALELAFSKFGLSAFALLSTRMPSGETGFSFAASVFATFNVPLSFGFFLTGAGGMLGINRTVDTDAMREALFDGRLDDLLFPANPIEDAPQILADMAAIMPTVPGQHFMGPAVRISWGQPSLIHICMGIIIEVGQVVRIVILGSVKMALPDEDAALVIFNLSFMGEIDFSEGRIDFDATLEGSRLLIFTITGDVAVRTGWGPGIFQIASLGGLHPLYPKPDNLPDLRRLSAGFGQPGDDVRLSISSYFAQTLNSVQFGARAELYAKGPRIVGIGQVTAEGFIGFDALIYFNPFSFLVDVEGGLSLMVNGNVKAALYFGLSLSGPNPFHITGKVWCKVCKIEVKFGVDETFGPRQSEPAQTASAVAALKAALQALGALEAGGSGTDKAAGRITFRDTTDPLIDPLGRLRVSQNAVPLEVRLEKLGEAEIIGATELGLRPVDTTLVTEDATADFVRGHFTNLGNAARLRAPVIETHVSGCVFTGTGLAASGMSIGEDYDYEVVVIEEREADSPEDQKPPKLIDPFKKLDFARYSSQYGIGRWSDGGAAGHGADPTNGVTLAPERFLLQHDAAKLQDATRPGDPVEIEALRDGGVAAMGLFSARRIAEQDDINAAVADYICAA